MRNYIESMKYSRNSNFSNPFCLKSISYRYTSTGHALKCCAISVPGYRSYSSPTCLSAAGCGVTTLSLMHVTIHISVLKAD